MSVINRIPLINEILGKLTSEQLSSLRSCINGEGATPIFRSLKPISNEHLTTSDKGVKPITIELATILGGMSAYEGYLIYTDEICYVICFSGDRNQGLNVLKINPSTCEAEFVNGSLTILELRSELDDALDNKSDGESGGGSGSGTDVVANPELTGTESELTGLEVDDTKYKISQLTIPHSITVGTGADTEDHIFNYLTKGNDYVYAPFGYSVVIDFKDNSNQTRFIYYGAQQYASAYSIFNAMKTGLESIAASMSMTLPTIIRDETSLNECFNYVLTALFNASQDAMAYTLMSALCNLVLGFIVQSSSNKTYTLFFSGTPMESPLFIDSSNNNQITALSSLFSSNSITTVDTNLFLNEFPSPYGQGEE